MEHVILESLPTGYGENVLVLLVQSPVTVFTYWEISAASREFLGDKDIALRLCTVVDGRSIPQMVVSPSFHIGNWYFHGVAPGRCYRSEIGWWEKGDFYPLLCSEIVETPPEVPKWYPRARRKGIQRSEGLAFVEAVNTIGISSGVLGRKGAH